MRCQHRVILRLSFLTQCDYMANVISSFLVGVGFDYDTKGAEEIGSGIDRVKSKALQLGAVVAGSFGIKTLTADFAQSRDQLGKFAEVFGVGAEDVQAFGNALASEGGTLESFMSQLQGIERLRAGLIVGDAGFIAQAGRAGIDTTGIEAATTATEAYLALANQFAGLSQQQRLNAAGALGLDEASIRLLSKGRTEVEEIVERFRRIRPVTDEMTDATARFNRQWLELTQNTGGFADQVSVPLIREINDITASMNSWIGANRELISSNINEFLDPLEGNLVAIATAATLLGAGGALGVLSGMARFIPLIGAGLASVAAGAAAVTAVGAAAAGGVAIGTLINEQLSEDTQVDIGRGIAQIMALFGSDRAQEALDVEFRAGGFSEGFRAIPGTAERLQRQGAPQAQNINVTLQLDGQMLDNRTIRVVDGMAQTAIDDLASSTGG